MIVPSDSNRPFPIATPPTEVLLKLLDHLDLEDLFVARYVCRAFHANALYILAGRKKQHQLDHPGGEWVRRMEFRKIYFPFRDALGKANFFYEATHPQELHDYFCSRCLQVIGKLCFFRCDQGDSIWSNSGGSARFAVLFQGSVVFMKLTQSRTECVGFLPAASEGSSKHRELLACAQGYFDRQELEEFQDSLWLQALRLR